MSLSSWLRDYLYIPLGGSRKGLDRAYHALSPWTVEVLGGLLLLTIEARGGDGSAPFIYFQF
jgi:D-alanyl-lipoteichoic acid acyltransferase DltB (MBOAT superfamily)